LLTRGGCHSLPDRADRDNLDRRQSHRRLGRRQLATGTAQLSDFAAELGELRGMQRGQLRHQLLEKMSDDV
jgi:hypothetical protein